MTKQSFSFESSLTTVEKAFVAMEKSTLSAIATVIVSIAASVTFNREQSAQLKAVIAKTQGEHKAKRYVENAGKAWKAWGGQLGGVIMNCATAAAARDVVLQLFKENGLDTQQKLEAVLYPERAARAEAKKQEAAKQEAEEVAAKPVIAPLSGIQAADPAKDDKVGQVLAVIRTFSAEELARFQAEFAAMTVTAHVVAA